MQKGNEQDMRAWKSVSIRGGGVGGGGGGGRRGFKAAG